ncbi:LysR family transcriptional regulator [Stappia sp.]|uniref:LysR family transcriptional regulator n=1 Tax=Stappia sp. TaxID=1870903 RepID=UPI003A998DD9
MINLKAGRYFLEITRCHSIRQAADRLHLAPSALSRQIANLERELGAELLERRSNGVQLTEAGLLLRDRLTEIFARLDYLESDLTDLQGMRTGRVTIATVEGVTRAFLAHCITAFTAENPGVRFRVLIRSRDRVFEALEQYDCHIGFVYDHFTHPVIEPLGQWRQPLMAFVPPGHPLAQGAPVSLQEVASYSYVLPDESFGIHQLLVRTWKKLGQMVKPVIVSNQLQFLIAYAMQASAILFVPAQAVQAELEAGTLVPVNLDCPDFQHRHISAAIRRDRQLPQSAETFLHGAVAGFPAWQARDEDILTRARLRHWVDQA